MPVRGHDAAAESCHTPRMRPTPVLVALLLLALPAAAAEDALYRATAFVTGQGEAERARGEALCLEEVLVKVSGDPSLRDDAGLPALQADAGRFVRSFRYHDRMSGIPVHDEQGTRERPFDLTVDFAPAAIDKALASLGRRKWPEPRPRLVVLLGIEDATASYVLARDGERGLGERESLAQAAAQRGIAVTLPDGAALAAAHLDYTALIAAPVPRLDALAQASGGNATLTGTLIWTEAALGWTAQWRLLWHGHEQRWRIRGVSFDDAFRDALDHAVAVLSARG
jgi:hypothetical protein